MSEALEAKNGAHERRLSTLDAETMEKLVVGGDLSKLSPDQRLQYYRVRCENAGLDPSAQPFQYIVLNSKLVLYATKACTDQLANIHGIQLQIVEQKTDEGMRIVTVRATTKNGRASEDVGAVPIGTLKGEQLANALMKAVTKAKRRTVLSLCGLGALDETEVDSIPDARLVRVDKETGDILDEGDRPFKDRKPRASAIPPRTHLDRGTGELTALDDPKEEARLRREEAGAFGGKRSRGVDWSRVPAVISPEEIRNVGREPGDDPTEEELRHAFGMEPDEAAVVEVLGVPIVSGETFDDIKNLKVGGSSKFKAKAWGQFLNALPGGDGERYLESGHASAAQAFSSGVDPSPWEQQCTLTLDALRRHRKAKEAEQARAIDLIAEREK